MEYGPIAVKLISIFLFAYFRILRNCYFGLWNSPIFRLPVVNRRRFRASAPRTFSNTGRIIVRNKLRLFVAAAIQSLLIVGAAQAVQAQVFGGRAIAITASATIGGSTTNFVSTDTGQLPPIGGDANASSPSYSIGSLLTTGVLTASTSGALKSSQSFAVVNDFSFSLNGVNVRANKVTVRTGCICCPEADLGNCAGTTEINTLVITDATGAQTVVTVTGEANQVVSLPGGLGTITINEQTGGLGGISVNGLHIRATSDGNTYDVVAATAESHLDCLSTVPTAAPVTVSGRVVTQTGQGISNATVSLTDDEGNTFSAVTGGSGNFSIAEVPSGATYILNVTHKRYRFTSQVIGLSDDLTVNITAN